MRTREEKLAYLRQWRAEHPNYMKQWRDRNPEKARAMVVHRDRREGGSQVTFLEWYAA